MTAETPPNRKTVRDDDTELIRAINAGHAEKFPELVRRYEQKLYNFGRRMCRNESDAEDLVQDTLLNVFRHLNDFRYETKFKNWLYRVAANTSLKKRRRSKFAPEPELSLDELARPDEAEPRVYRRVLGEWVAAAKPANAIEAAKFSAHDGTYDDRWNDEDCKPPKACNCRPGTAEKIDELARRIESGESLFCECDANGRLYTMSDVAAWCDRDEEKKEKS